MTISQALISLNSFPIPALLIEKVGIERGLTVSEDYTLAIGESQSFKLATADVYFWLSTHADFSEQEVRFSQQEAIKKQFAKMANDIYLEFDDPKYSGVKYGYVGDEWNG